MDFDFSSKIQDVIISLRLFQTSVEGLNTEWEYYLFICQFFFSCWLALSFLGGMGEAFYLQVFREIGKSHVALTQEGVVEG